MYKHANDSIIPLELKYRLAWDNTSDNALRNKKAIEFNEATLEYILKCYAQLKADYSVWTVITNSMNLIMELCEFGIEAFALPVSMEHSLNDFHSMFPFVKKNYMSFRPEMICNNPAIVSEFVGRSKTPEYSILEEKLSCLASDNLGKQQMYFWYLVKNICRNFILDKDTDWTKLMLYLKENESRYSFPPASYLIKQISVMNKIDYMFKSMRTSGLIHCDDFGMRSAFNMLFWNKLYEVGCTKRSGYIDQVNKLCVLHKDSGLSRSNPFELNCFKLYADIMIDAYGVEEKRIQDLSNSIKGAMYTGYLQISWKEATDKTTELIDDIIENRNQKTYINRLLYNEHRTTYIGIDDTYLLKPFQFEELIARLFKAMGYEAETTRKSGDQGVDVIAKKGVSVIAIQAKCYKDTVVGNSAIQEVVAGKSIYKAKYAYVVTNSTFSKSAVELALANNVTLWDKNKLGEMLDTYPVMMSSLG